MLSYLYPNLVASPLMGKYMVALKASMVLQHLSLSGARGLHWFHIRSDVGAVLEKKYKIRTNLPREQPNFKFNHNKQQPATKPPNQKNDDFQIRYRKHCCHDRWSSTTTSCSTRLFQSIRLNIRLQSFCRWQHPLGKWLKP